MPKIVDHDRYRKELLRKAFDLFAEKGYATITMRQIAQGLGVSTGTLYHYFPSKEALFEQLMEELTELDLLQFKTQIQQSNTLRERLHAAFELLEQNRDYFLKQTLLITDFYQHQQRQGKDVSQVFDQLCDRIQSISADLAGIDDPELTMFMLSFADGLILQEIYGQNRINYQAQAELLSEMMTLYLEKHNHESRNPT